jgi:MFS family permease
MTANGLPDPESAPPSAGISPGVAPPRTEPAPGLLARIRARVRESGGLPGARPALILLVLINLFNYIDRQVLAANIPHIEAALLPKGGANNGKWLGALVPAFMVAYMVFAPLFGWLANHVARWRLIGIGVIVWSLASGASGLAGAFWVLLLTRCFVGIGEAAYGPIAPDVISDLYPVKRRGSILAYFYAAIPVGSALGYVNGGLFGWPWSFFWVVPPGLLLGAWCFFMPEPARGQADLKSPTPVRTTTLKDYRILLRTPSYVLNTLGMTAMTFALGGMGAWMPDYVHTYRGVPDLAWVNQLFGIILVASGVVATILGGLAGDWLRPRFSGSYFLVSGVAMLVAFPIFLAALWVPFPGAWVLIFLACFFLFFNTGPTNTILANVTHPALRAQGFAVNIFIIHAFGDAFSPFVIGAVADAYAVEGMKNLHAGFLATSVMILVGGVLWLIGVPFLGRDTALAPHRLDAEAAKPQAAR